MTESIEAVTLEPLQSSGEITVQVKVKRWNEAHPYGNGTATEHMMDWEIMTVELNNGKEFRYEELDEEMQDWLDRQVEEEL